MTAVIFPSTARPAMITSKSIYNGCYPDAEVMTRLQEETNRLVAYRVKGWSFAGGSQGVGVAYTRWRTFIHTSSHCRYIWVRVLALTSATTSQRYTSVTFYVPGEGTPTATANFTHSGGGNAGANDIEVGQVRPINGTALVELDPDTDYEVYISDVNEGTTLACCLFEYALAHDTANGYIANGVSAGTKVLDAHRQAMLPVLRTAWKRNGAPLITWSCDGDADVFTNSTGNYRNILDSSTSVSAATPGFTIDLRKRSTVRRASSGVPVIMRAYCKTSGTTGNVRLFDSSGATMATATTSSGTAAWVSSGAFYLPETLAKYDIAANLGGIGTTTVYSVVLYQYEA